jgi:tRNA (guanine26-N2/guanine27-N2)-dimethyltransferase
MTIKGLVQPSDEYKLDHELDLIIEGESEFYKIKGEVYDTPAFFNPVMVLNRDLTILFTKLQSVIQQRKIRVFEPLGGIGVRAIRLAKEIPDAVESVTINDLGEVSSNLAAYNINESKTNSIVAQYQREAKALMAELAELRFKYQLIDLDPFGPPVEFLDFLWGIAQRNSIVCVTATDMTALCGVFPESCLRKYGALSNNNYQTHETAARILIASVVRSAARFEKVADPIFTVSSDHYIKIFFKVNDSRGIANEMANKIKRVGSCTKCQKFKFLEIEETFECHEAKIFGPLWSGNLFNQELCNQALEIMKSLNLPSSEKIEKFLLEGKESHNIPYYYALEYIASFLHINTPKFEKIQHLLNKKGFKANKTLFRKQAIRTDASLEELLGIALEVSDI